MCLSRAEAQFVILHSLLNSFVLKFESLKFHKCHCTTAQIANEAKQQEQSCKCPSQHKFAHHTLLKCKIILGSWKRGYVFNIIHSLNIRKPALKHKKSKSCGEVCCNFAVYTHVDRYRDQTCGYKVSILECNLGVDKLNTNILQANCEHFY